MNAASAWANPEMLLCMRAPREGAVAGVQVPVAGVDGDHVGADVGADQLGGVLQRFGERGRVPHRGVGDVVLAAIDLSFWPGPFEMATASRAPDASGPLAEAQAVASEP